MRELSFVVYGEAAPAGSKRGFVRGGRVMITDASARSRPWKAQVTDAAIEAMGFTLVADKDGKVIPMFDEPVVVAMTFHVARPKSHFGSGKNAGQVKASAPTRPTTKPDLLKLARAVEDALTQICYRDDSQIVDERLSKWYGDPPRVEITIRPIDGQEYSDDAVLGAGL